MLGRGGILLCPRGFPAVTVRLKLRDGAAKSPCTCGLDSEIYSILGFLIVIYLCYKDWSVYLATFAGACVVIACNTLPFIDSLVGDYVSGMFTAVKGFFFMILFGCLQSKIYTESGAAYTIADSVMNRLLKENMSSTGKNLIAMAVILVIGTILNLGGIIAGVVIVLMYPIALVIFERCDIPKKFILGILGAGSFTFTLTIPGSPQVTNVAAMTVLGTAADVALVPDPRHHEPAHQPRPQTRRALRAPPARPAL